MYPVSRPGSERVPTVDEAVLPIAQRILSVLGLSDSRTNPTALIGAKNGAGVVVMVWLSTKPLVLLPPPGKSSGLATFTRIAFKTSS